jgi:multidrug efflux pump subunit AcrB
MNAGARWARWLAGRASLVWLAAVALAALGAAAVTALPSGIYPEMEFPRVVIVARLGQEPPEIIEAKLTRPIEEAVSVVQNVRYVRARTIRGAVEVSVQLVDGTDPLQAQQLCQAAVDGIDLPASTVLQIERVLPTSVPVVTFNVSGTADPRDVRDAADRIIRPALARVAGVGGVEVQGGRIREIEIVLRPEALAAHRLTPAKLAEGLAAQDVLIGVGRVTDQHQTLPVLVDAQPRDLATIAALPIARGPNGPVPLSAVADVIEGWEDPTVVVAGPHGESVVVTVSRLPGASTPSVVEAAQRTVAALHDDGALPATMRVDTVYDQAALVAESMNSVRDAILVGVALALVVIGFFLRDARAGLVAAVPVPLSLLATFAAMRATGITLNLMSLGGLAIAIGLVVDDAIVVTEGIVRRLEDGSTPEDAAREGVADLFAAVVGTTLTTVVVFAPLALLSGVTGSFLGALAGTMSAAVLLSLFYAVTVAPLLARHVLRARPRVAHESRFTAFVAGFIRWIVHHRLVAVAAAAVLVGAGVLGLTQVKTGFLPAMDEGAFVLDFFLPPGTSLEETDRIAQRIDRVLATTPAVATFTRRTGTEMGPATATAQNQGDIMVRLVPAGRRGSIESVIDEVREHVEAEVPEARVEFVQVLQDVLADLAGNPAPIEIKMLGDDPRVLERAAAEAGRAIAQLPMLVDFFDGVEGDVPVLNGRIDRVLAGGLGLDAASIAADLEVALRGRVVAEVEMPSRTIGVRARFPDAVRFDATRVAAAPMAWGPSSLTVDAVLDTSRPPSPSVLRREGLRPAVVMSAALAGGDLGGAERAVRETLARVDLPPGVQPEVGGQAASAAAAQRELVRVGVIGAALVLLVLVVQLRSLRLSLVVLVGAPLAVVGALATLWITGIPLDVSSLTGCILLVGLVVKNGILLLEHAQIEIGRGAALEDALVAAVERRLRPILMTTLATLAGLAPLAAGIGAGAAQQRPLAVAVIGGLVLSTAITVLILPGLAALTMPRRGRVAEVS